MDLLIKTRRLLRRAFPRPAQIDLEEFHGIMGEVTSRAFRGLNGTQRQAMLRTALKDNMKPQEWKQIGLIVAITPEERRLKAELDSLCNGY